MITQEQYDFYWKNGYLILKDVLTLEECDFAYAQIRQYADKNFAAIMNPDRPEFLIAQSFGNKKREELLGKKVEYINKAHQVAALMRSIMKNPKAVSALEDLQRREVAGLMTQMLFKEAGSPYASQAWEPHQDNAYPRNSNGQYITTNFFFEAARKENGSLYVYPGSHLEGLMECETRASYRETIGKNPGNTISEKILAKYDKIDVEFEKGDMLVLNGNCVHGSYPNVSDRSRPFLSCSYISRGEIFISGKNAQRKEILLR